VRFLATVVGSVLAAGAIFGPGAVDVRAEAPREEKPVLAVPAPAERPAPLPGTAEEARDYERREAESPEVQEFVGGGWDFVIGLLVIAALVLVIILLAREI